MIHDAEGNGGKVWNQFLESGQESKTEFFLQSRVAV